MASGAAAGAADPRRVVRDLLQQISCYDILPSSGKAVVFDASMSLRLAFFALVEHGIPAAVVWDTSQGRVIAVLEVRDLLELLARHQGEAARLMQTSTVRDWLGAKFGAPVVGGAGAPTAPAPIVTASPETTLLELGLQLRHTGSWQAAVVAKTRASDPALAASGPHRREGRLQAPPPPASVLGIITQRSLMDVVVARQPLGALAGVHHAARKLKIGQWGAVPVAKLDQPLGHILRVMATNNLSAVPLTSDDGVVVDIFTQEDVLFLTNYPHFEVLGQPVLAVRRAQLAKCGGGTNLRMVRENDSLRVVLDTMVVAGVDRVVAIDDGGRCVGLISTSDVVDFVLADCQPPTAASVGPASGSAAMAVAPPAVEGARAGVVGVEPAPDTPLTAPVGSASMAAMAPLGGAVRAPSQATMDG